MEQLISQALSVAKGMAKYRWYSLGVAWIVLIAGIGVAYKLPDDYRASARVYVDTQSILRPLLASMTTVPDVDQQVSIMSRTLLSRPNIERVIRMVDLDLHANTAKEKDELINELMQEISLGGTSRNDIYTISYNNPDPMLAKNVVQSLLTIFIESSLGSKKQDSANAIKFIEEQIKQYEEKLRDTEHAIKDFKLQNSSFVTGGNADYNSKLLKIEEQLGQARLELAEAEEARNSIRREIAGEEPIFDSAPPQAREVSANPELDDRIQSLKKTLDLYRLQYTEEHPDVIATKRLIAQFEARKEEEEKLALPTTVIGKNYSPVMQQLKIALSDAEARVAAMNARVEEYQNRAARLKTQANSVPEIEAQYAQLNRDYQINKDNYERLIASRDSARMSADLSTATEMIAFRIIDPPTVPTKPTGPNRPALLSAMLGVALAAGVAVAFGLSQIRPTFVSLAHLRETTGLPVLGSVSMTWTEIERKRRRNGVLAFAFVFVSLLASYGAAMGMLLVRL
jgi:polysaccharide chain length determinant protein (PEP-CTERM system associated)